MPVLPFLVRRGFHPKLGARPMRDAVEKLIGDAVAVDLLTGGTGCGTLIVDETGQLPIDLLICRCAMLNWHNAAGSIASRRVDGSAQFVRAA